MIRAEFIAQSLMTEMKWKEKKVHTWTKEEKYNLYSRAFTRLQQYYQHLQLEVFVEVCGILQRKLGIR